MIIVATGDWHGDWTTGGVERHEEVFDAADQVVDCAIDLKADLFLFLGDLTDPDVSEPLAHRSIAAAIERGKRLQAARITERWLTGNHDVMEDGRGSHTLMALAKAGLHVMDRPYMEFFPMHEVTLGYLPYTPLTHRYDPQRTVQRWLDDEALALVTRRVVVAGHCTRIPEYAAGSETHDMPRGRDLTFPVADALALKPGATTLLNGHYHERHTDGLVLTPGSLIRCTHGEEMFNPGWLVLEV